MFVLKRNQIIITALIIMVAVAGYLNYADREKDTVPSIALNDDGEVLALIPNEPEGPVVIDASGNLSQSANITELTPSEADNPGGDLAIAENDNPDIYLEANEEEEDPGAAVFVSANLDTDYFIQAKLDREQARGRQKEILTEMINNSNIDQEQRTLCATAMIEIQKRIEKETAAEAMIEAKGFAEVYVRIDDDTVDVVVSKESLSDAEIAQIEDIVKRKTGMAADKIRISPMKK
jgi:stage III sporulation protein AH